jgi:hypothetical protein
MYNRSDNPFPEQVVEHILKMISSDSSVFIPEHPVPDTLESKDRRPENACGRDPCHKESDADPHNQKLIDGAMSDR